MGYFEKAHKLLADLLASGNDNLEYLVEMGYVRDTTKGNCKKIMTIQKREVVRVLKTGEAK